MAIFRSIWNRLAGQTPTTDITSIEVPAVAEPPTPTPVPPAKIEKDLVATLPPRYAALGQLLNSRQLIEVKLGEHANSHQTLIMKIEIKRGLLWLDDLYPNQHQLALGDSISIRHHRNAELLDFQTTIVAWGDNEDMPGFAVLLPNAVNYQPRRQHKRVDLSSTANLSIKVRAMGQDIQYGRVLDISSKGIRLSMAGNLLDHFKHGALLPLCELKLSDELHIRCNARVRALRLLKTPHRHTQMSIEFGDLSPLYMEQLEQFISHLIHYQQHTQQQQLRTA
jgi:c-di-GMP-binding flagellar brake protein YcgR